MWCCRREVAIPDTRYVHVDTEGYLQRTRDVLLVRTHTTPVGRKCREGA